MILYDKLMDVFEAALNLYATAVIELAAASATPEQIGMVVKALGALEYAVYRLVPEFDRKLRRGGNPWALHILCETTRQAGAAGYRSRLRPRNVCQHWNARARRGQSPWSAD